MEQDKDNQLDSLAYFLGRLHVAQLRMGLFTILLIAIVGTIAYPKEVYKMVRSAILSSKFLEAEYAAPITAGLFLVWFCIFYFGLECNSHPPVKFMFSLILAAVATGILIVAIGSWPVLYS